MTAHPRRDTILLALAGALSLGTAEPGMPAKPPPETAEARPDAESRPVIYRPPRLGSPRTKVGGGVRGARALPTPLALAPDHLALTHRPAPSLFWHLDAVAADDRGLRFVFTLIEPEAEEPVLELELGRPARAGIQRIRLEEHGVRLMADTEYEWSVSLVANPERRAQDVVSQGFIMRVSEPELEARPPDAALYADRGLWYDSLETLSDAIGRSPEDPELLAARNWLLRQVRLEAAVE